MVSKKQKTTKKPIPPNWVSAHFWRVLRAFVLMHAVFEQSRYLCVWVLASRLLWHQIPSLEVIIFFLFCICVCCVSRCTNPGRKYDIKMKTLGVLNAATFFKVLVTGSRTKLGVNLLDPTETTYCITGINLGLFFNCLYDDKGKALGERDACRSISIKPSEELL